MSARSEIRSGRAATGSFSGSKGPINVTRLALTRAEAAAALGMSVDSFERHVQSELRIVRRGKLRLVPLGEIERWLEENAARVMDA